MKLFLLSSLMRSCDTACRFLHRAERRAQRLREWAWIRATKANLEQCNVRAVKRSAW